MFGVRFDDAVSGRSRVLTNPVRSLIACSVDEVLDVMAEIEAESSAGRWVGGYVAYEAAAAFDDHLQVRQGTSDPLAWFGVFESCSEGSHPSGGEDRRAHLQGAYSVSAWNPAITKAGYGDAFQTIRDHIRKGDSYQVNLTFPLTAAFQGDPTSFYRDLIEAQRPAYAAHLWHDDRHVVSVSPEQFFSIGDGRIVTRPMKGTARRGRWSAEDERIEELLAGSKKDRAENVMIVDLIRNDLGRVAEFGSVTVDDLFTVERYETLWQMTSGVSAKLSQGTRLSDVFAALFPCGSVTGAPKVSSMGIIAEVESHHRGVYCGAIGFVPPGNGLEGASFNVGIRTATIDLNEGVASYGVGGGVTWYSTQEAEYEETVTKALVLSSEHPSTLIETIRWDPTLDGGWLWLEDHLNRLEGSARYWGFAFDRPSTTDVLERAVAGRNTPRRVRFEMARDGVGEVSSQAAPERISMGPGPSSELVVLAIDENPVISGNPMLFHKVGDRAGFAVRRSDHRAADDVVMVNEEGRITETTTCNIAFLIDGIWVTPPVEDGLLPGVMRGRLLGEGSVKERAVSAPEAIGADAVAVFNSVRGWRQAIIDAAL